MVEINKAPPLRYIICGCWIPSSYMNYWFYMDVSQNRGTPKWMVYNGKPYQNG